MVHKISSVEGNLFTFGLVYYFCPGSQKINFLTAQYKRISNEQGVFCECLLVSICLCFFVCLCRSFHLCLHFYSLRKKHFVLLKAFANDKIIHWCIRESLKLLLIHPLREMLCQSEIYSLNTLD